MTVLIIMNIILFVFAIHMNRRACYYHTLYRGMKAKTPK